MNKFLWLASLLVAVGCGVAAEPVTLDTSSAEATHASTEAMMEGMTDAEKANLTKDIMELTLGSLDPNNLTANPTEKLHGLTAEEIHALAEQFRANK